MAVPWMAMAECSFHPGRETRVSCSACGKSICPDCMTPTPVGMRCPECSREKTRVTNLASASDRPAVTIAIIAANVAVFLIASLSAGGFSAGANGDVNRFGWLYGPSVAHGAEYWRLVTSGFLHAGFFHLLMNMIFIWILGSMLEPALGRLRFAVLYCVCLLCGSMGAMLLQPDVPVVGASGAAFGLLGAAIVMARRRGIDIWGSGLGPILVLNLVTTFLVPGIAIGAHLGGVAGGFIAGFAMEEIGERRGANAAIAACAAIGLFAVVVSIAAAAGGGPIHGPTGL